MPIKSAKQWRLMAAIAHGQKARGIGGLGKSTARKFIKETPKKKRSMFARSYK